MSTTRSEWQSDVTVVLGHALTAPGQAELWLDTDGWGGAVTFQAFNGVRSPETFELEIPRYGKHMVEVMRANTNTEARSAATTIRFKGRGVLGQPSDPLAPIELPTLADAAGAAG